MDGTAGNTRQRPIGVSIIAVLSAVAGGTVLLGALVGFFARMHAAQTAWVNVITAFALAVLVAGGYLVVAYGLWELRTWAYWTAVVVSMADIAVFLIAWGVGRYDVWTTLATFLVPAFVMLYLLLGTGIGEAFGT